jgi:biopolymer transport protein ExbB/TolQ
MTKQSNKVLQVVGGVMGIVTVLGTVIWTLISFHNSDIDKVDERASAIKAEVVTTAQQSRAWNEKEHDSLVTKDALGAELKGVQFQISAMKEQQQANKQDLDRQLRGIMRAVEKRR